MAKIIEFPGARKEPTEVPNYGPTPEEREEDRAFRERIKDYTDMFDESEALRVRGEKGPESAVGLPEDLTAMDMKKVRSVSDQVVQRMILDRAIEDARLGKSELEPATIRALNNLLQRKERNIVSDKRAALALEYVSSETDTALLELDEKAIGLLEQQVPDELRKSVSDMADHIRTKWKSPEWDEDRKQAEDAAMLKARELSRSGARTLDFMEHLDRIMSTDESNDDSAPVSLDAVRRKVQKLKDVEEAREMLRETEERPPQYAQHPNLPLKIAADAQNEHIDKMRQARTAADLAFLKARLQDFKRKQNIRSVK